ncbi:MAG: hypothetical protein KA714_05925 [Limnoraphis sp. WC205]|nr:hypothetical protein [Limnoraphis sp. WC205]
MVNSFWFWFGFFIKYPLNTPQAEFPQYRVISFICSDKKGCKTDVILHQVREYFSHNLSQTQTISSLSKSY